MNYYAKTNRPLDITWNTCLVFMRDKYQNMGYVYYSRALWPLDSQIQKIIVSAVTIWGNTVNCSSNLKYLANPWPSAPNFSPLLEHFFLTVGQNNFGNKIPLRPRK